MTSVLRATLRFLDPLPRFHGRGSGGDPEWPPSPLRFFQAVVCASATRWREDQFRDYAQPALRWLELRQPSVVTPDVPENSFGYRMYVPNNSGDLMTAAWARGDTETSMAKFRVEKDVRPTHLSGEAVHYLFPLPPEGCPHLEVLRAAARSVTHLGWGIDMVAGDADVISEEEAAKLPGHRWRVVPAGGVPLRVPKAGTLANLMQKHQAFLGRLSSDGFKPVPPLSCFDTVHYHSPTVAGLTAPSRPMIAFEIHRTIEDQEKPEHAGKSKFRPFHHVRRVATVAGMVRHATAKVARTIGWADADVVRQIKGHGDEKDGQATSDDRLQFLPLPSMQPVVGVGGIRRVLVVGPPGFDLAPLRRQLNGEELIDRDTCQPVAMLSGIACTDKGVMPFLGESETWSTVTPVILPGFDDPAGLRKKLNTRDGKSAEGQKHLLARLDSRILALIWKAFHQAGWSPDALAGAVVEYRNVGWLRGLDPAKNYQLPPLHYPRFHLRVTFPRKVKGPIAVGAGRYRGFGLMAAEGGGRG